MEKKFRSTKEYLGQILRLERMIQNKLSEVSRLRTLAYNIPAVNVEEKVQTGCSGDKMSNSVIRIVDMEQEICEHVEKLKDTRETIIEQIESLEDADMYHVLAGIYILDRPVCELQAEMGMSYKNINRIHIGALTEFERLYGKTYLRDGNASRGNKCPKMS